MFRQKGEPMSDVEMKALNDRIKELEASESQLKSSNERLLSESKDYKTRAGEYRTKLDELERTRVEGGNDINEKLKYEQERSKRASDEVKKYRNTILDSNVRATVAKFAKDVHSLDDVLNQKEFAGILKSAIDPETLSVNEEIAKDYVNKVLAAKPFLKKNIEVPPVNPGKPKGKDVVPQQKNNYSSMSSKEIMKDILENN